HVSRAVGVNQIEILRADEPAQRGDVAKKLEWVFRVAKLDIGEDRNARGARAARQRRHLRRRDHDGMPALHELARQHEGPAGLARPEVVKVRLQDFQRLTRRTEIDSMCSRYSPRMRE